MGNQFEVTYEILNNAESYLPILLKEQLAVTAARDCIKPTSMIHAAGEKTDDISEKLYSLPPVYCESTSSKSRVLLTILMNCYLKVNLSDDSLMCSINDFDQYASSHILNQIERYKSTDLRGKAFDLIADYREMEKYLNSAIYSVLREKNDPITRLLTSMSKMLSEEGIANMKEQAQLIGAELQNERNRQGQIVSGDGGDADVREAE